MELTLEEQIIYEKNLLLLINQILSERSDYWLKKMMEDNWHPTFASDFRIYYHHKQIRFKILTSNYYGWRVNEVKFSYKRGSSYPLRIQFPVYSSSKPEYLKDDNFAYLCNTPMPFNPVGAIINHIIDVYNIKTKEELQEFQNKISELRLDII